MFCSKQLLGTAAWITNGNEQVIKSVKMSFEIKAEPWRNVKLQHFPFQFWTLVKNRFFSIHCTQRHVITILVQVLLLLHGEGGSTHSWHTRTKWYNLHSMSSLSSKKRVNIQPKPQIKLSLRKKHRTSLKWAYISSESSMFREWCFLFHLSHTTVEYYLNKNSQTSSQRRKIKFEKHRSMKKACIGVKRLP